MKPEERAAAQASHWTAYDFAIVRVVPHVHVGAFVDAAIAARETALAEPPKRRGARR